MVELFVQFVDLVVLAREIILLRTRHIHQIAHLGVLHLEGELQVLLDQGLLLALYAFIREEYLQLLLCLKLCS